MILSESSRKVTTIKNLPIAGRYLHSHHHSRQSKHIWILQSYTSSQSHYDQGLVLEVNIKTRTVSQDPTTCPANPRSCWSAHGWHQEGWDHWLRRPCQAHWSDLGYQGCSPPCPVFEPWLLLMQMSRKPIKNKANQADRRGNKGEKMTSLDI